MEKEHMKFQLLQIWLTKVNILKSLMIKEQKKLDLFEIYMMKLLSYFQMKKTVCFH